MTSQIVKQERFGVPAQSA